MAAATAMAIGMAIIDPLMAITVGSAAAQHGGYIAVIF